MLNEKLQTRSVNKPMTWLSGDSNAPDTNQQTFSVPIRFNAHIKSATFVRHCSRLQLIPNGFPNQPMTSCLRKSHSGSVFHQLPCTNPDIQIIAGSVTNGDIVRSSPK